MLSKNRSLLLLIILAVVVVFYLLLTYTRNNEKNFRTQLDEFDTSLVNRIEIYVDNPPEDIFLVKKSGSWMVDLPTMELAADDDRVESVLAQLDGTKILNMAANDPSKWDEFNTADEKGTRIKIMHDTKVLADLIIGKFDFIQPKSTQQQNPYRKQPQGEMRSYVRIFGQDEVYTIDGMISFGIGKKADDYLDKKLTNFSFEEISEIDFAENNSFRLTQNEGNWFVDNEKADSTTVVKYLRTISNQRGKQVLKTAFDGQNPYATLTIGLPDENTVEIEAFTIDSTSYALRSSSNPGNVIIDTDGSVVEKIFVSRDYLLGKKE